ncbi:MAG: hypothetical protein JO157_06970, partial [Acetobacteraceae bacterium]|nr:hypothetical protein [Acetobacteraceae bacterium]
MSRVLVSRKGLLAYLIGAVVVLFDQLSKGWALHAMQLYYGVTPAALAQAC